MAEIPLITYEYLLGAVPIKGKPNNFFGSVALSASPGLFSDAFRYRLTVAAPENEEDAWKVTAEWYIGWQSYDVVEKEKVKKEVFSAGEEGAAAANRWLKEELSAIVEKK